eukprot:5362655-Karenia_brevis.AAC.1
MLRDDSVFKIAEPEQLMEQSWNTSQVKENGPTKAANMLTYAQRKKMQSREKVQEGVVDLRSETLDPAYADKLRREHANVSAERKRKANEAWMEKLRQGEYPGPTLDRSKYLALRDKAVE